ncbi:MAG: Lrp/AsnC ligand binding domain-containing protein [Dehalococcoidia bacterium]|nr:Lrp/AsnC ligand binding domain-containing protein [Dehalococcoidia bacterium]
MIKAYVLIVTHPGATRRVAEALKALPDVDEIHEVMGPYDIVVELVVENLSEVPPILADRIRTLDGIQSTTSLVAFPEG